MTTLKFNNFTEAWEKINEMFITNPGFLVGDTDNMRYSKATYLYNVTLQVEDPKLDPNFDFGTHFNYTFQKWRTLVSNYICPKEFSELKSIINSQLRRKKVFNVPFQFTNRHHNGKECLLSLVVTRKPNKQLNLTLFLRASEVTKRLAVDFLLAQRIGEYLFEGEAFSVTYHFSQMFNDDTVLLMYYAHNPKRVARLLRVYKQTSEVAKVLSERLNEMLNSTEDKMKRYKVHFRAFKVLRPDLYKYPTTLAKDCKLPF